MDAGNSQKSDPEKLSSALAMAVLIAVSFSLLAATAWSQADPEVAALIQRLKDKNTNVKVRRNAALALGFMKANQKEAVPALVAALKDPDAEVRRDAAFALGEIGPGAKEAVPALIAALKDPDGGVRRIAIGVLGMIGLGAKEAVPALIAALKDPDAGVRGSAAQALGWIGLGAKEAVPALIAALKDPLRLSESAGALVTFADAARDAKRTDMIEQIDQVAKALEANSFPEHAKRVRIDADLLRAIQPPWYQRLFAEVGHHPVIAGVAAVYFGLFFVSVVLLLLYPLALLRISQAAASLSTAPTINKVIGVGEAVFVFGLFRYHPRVLDAWVSRHIAPARDQFNSTPTAKQREVHVVEVPVELDHQVIPGLRAEDLQHVFNRNRTDVLVWGEGGSGKTSLACQIARWVMSDDRATRPCAQRMLPILIEQDLNLEVGKDKAVLIEVIRGQLKELTGDVDAPPQELVRHLLKRKRVLLIADGLSELSPVTQNKLRPLDPEFDANALVVTSRLEEGLDGVIKTVIHPHRIPGNRLSSFMEAYLTRCGKRALFDDAEFFEGCKRLSSMVGERDTTVLLARLYADQIIAAKERQASEDLPENIPDLMLEYLNRINRKNPQKREDRRVHAAAKTIAWECLRQSFRPIPAPFDAVVAALGEDAKPTLEYMERDLHLVETIGAARDRIRFALDPLAEYMAAFEVLERYGDDEDAWREFLARADAAQGAPESIKGFLLAVRDCCQAKGTELNVPSFVAVELVKRAGLDPQAVSTALVQQRVKDLIFRLNLPHADDRGAAPHALGTIGADAQAAVPALIEKLGDADGTVRYAALVALRQIAPNNQTVVPALTQSLNDGTPGAVGLVAALSAEGLDDAMFAAEALKQFHPETLHAMQGFGDGLKQPDYVSKPES